METLKRFSKKLIAAIVTIIIFFAAIFSAPIWFPFTQPTGDSGNWWNTGFSYRIKITLNNSVVSENLANFPVPVVLSSSQTSFWSHVNRTTGSDVRFVDADNTTELYFEVEQFNATTNATTMWVKVPQINSESATDFIWIYYGNGTAAFDAYCSSSNSWDSSYKAVWHLNETTGNYNDATTNANAFTTVSGVVRTASPKLGNYGPTWDGVNDYLSVAHSASINFTTVLTIEEWINTDAVTTEQAVISKNGQSNDHGWNHELYDANNIHIQDGEASSTMEYTTTDALASNNVWYHCSWVLNMTAANVAIAYVNGVAQTTTDTMTTWVDTGYTLYLGISRPITTFLYPYDGEIDEVRLSNTVRSANWILACYQYQVDQSKFAFASEDTQTTADTTNPTFSGVSTNTTTATTPCNFTAILADETALANYTFGTNNTGAWTNESAVVISGTSYKANTTKTLNATVGIVVQWEYWFADSSNNLNNTGIQTLTTTGTILNVGWTNFTCWTIDVDKTLAQVNISLTVDVANWTTFSLELSNGTRFPFMKGMSYNSAIVVNSNDKLYVYCTVAGEWKHTYP